MRDETDARSIFCSTTFDGKVSRRLNGIGVEKHSALSAHLAYTRQSGDRARAYLIVRVHDADKTGIVSDSICDLLCRDRSERTDREQCDLEALFFQLFERMEHSVMLKGGGNNVLLTLARTYPCRRHKRLIVGFAAAGGKVYIRAPLRRDTQLHARAHRAAPQPPSVLPNAGSTGLRRSRKNTAS